MSATEKRTIEELNLVNDALREENAELAHWNIEKDLIIKTLRDALKSRSTKGKLE